MARRSSKKSGMFLQRARASMEKRGTVGSFGKATPAKIERGLQKGGAMGRKAAFAKAMRTIARHRRERSARKRAARR